MLTWPLPAYKVPPVSPYVLITTTWRGIVSTPQTRTGTRSEKSFIILMADIY